MTVTINFKSKSYINQNPGFILKLCRYHKACVGSHIQHILQQIVVHGLQLVYIIPPHKIISSCQGSFAKIGKLKSVTLEILRSAKQLNLAESNCLKWLQLCHYNGCQITERTHAPLSLCLQTCQKGHGKPGM